ncbi:MAG: hypothetical protein VKK03_02310 [Synechococcus sp.]|nr:hypothetical protein [Synechococcus sp.]
MRSRLSLTALALAAGLVAAPSASIAQIADQGSGGVTKVLASEAAGFNAAAVQALIKRGDAAAAAGNLAEARKDYDNARVAAKQLLNFYRQLSTAFTGVDSRIPREMGTKGIAAAGLLAEVNLRLAALFRRQNQPEVAVPVLVEVIQLMTPRHSQGQKAYQILLELGFVETPFAAAKPAGN